MKRRHMRVGAKRVYLSHEHTWNVYQHKAGTWQPSVTANIDLSFPLLKFCIKSNEDGYHNLKEVILGIKSTQKKVTGTNDPNGFKELEFIEAEYCCIWLHIKLTRVKEVHKRCARNWEIKCGMN